MKQRFRIVDTEQDFPLDLTIIISNESYKCNKYLAKNESKKIARQILNSYDLNVINLDFDDHDHQFDAISDLLSGKSILFNKENIEFLINISEYLDMKELHNKSLEFQNYLNDISQLIEDDEGIQKLIDLEDKLFSLNSTPLGEVFVAVQSFSNKKIISQIIINSCSSNPGIIEKYLEFLVQLNADSKTENYIEIFLNTLLDPYIRIYQIRNEYIEFPKNVEFILRWLIDHDLITFDDILKHNIKFYSFYLIDFLSEKNHRIIEIMSSIYKDTNQTFFKNFEQIKENNWKLHKKYVRNGVNPDPVALALRTDDIDSLQRLLSMPCYQSSHVCYEKIPRTVYERCPFVNDSPTFLEYAAYFGSVRCFKNLVVHDMPVNQNSLKHGILFDNNGDDNEDQLYTKEHYKNLAKYAVASGNIEIIHIVDQKGYSFDNTLEIAFNYAHYDIFDWIHFNKMHSIQLPLSEFLTKCVHQMRISLMINLLEFGLDPNDSKLVTAAVEEENDLILDFLLKIKGIEINENGIWRLNAETLRGNIQQIIDEEQTAELNLLQTNLNPPLIVGCIRKNKEIVNKLLQCPNIDVNIRGKHYKTALSTVAYNGDLEICQMLLDHKDTIVNIFEEKRKTPFYVACENNNFEIVKLLAHQPGININEHTREDEKLTPLHIAILNGNEEITAYLLSLDDIDVNWQTKDGKTPLHQACQARKNLNIVNMLLNHKDINLNVFTIDHFSPLHYACGKSSLQIFRKLYDTGCYDINMPSHEILSGIFINTIIQLESGILIDFLYCTPFLLSCRNRDVDIVEYILDNISNVDINAVSFI